MMKKIILIYPAGTERARVSRMADVLRENNSGVHVARRVSATATTIMLLIVDKRRGKNG